MKKIKISFVVHAYNEERELPKTLKRLRKIIKSSKYPVEVIGVDENSSDNSLKILRRFTDRVYALKDKRPSFGRSRHFGCAKAKGEIIVSLDPDTYLPMNTIEKLVETFEDRDVVAAGAHVYVYPWLETLTDRFWHHFQNFTYEFQCFIKQHSLKGEFQAFHASAYKKIGGYNPKLSHCEDMDIVRRIAKLGKVVFIKNFKVFESPARYRKYGYLRTYIYWNLNAIRYRLNLPLGEYKRVSH
jgi:GT2 family glycosyltransferase